MSEFTASVPELLLTCEKTGVAPPYVWSEPAKGPVNTNESPGQVVTISSHGGEIFVVSDLHLASGRGRDGRYEGSENFFSDAAFHRFLDFAHRRSRPDRPSILIINGDFIDFLRVANVPGSKGRLTRWRKFLKQFKLDRRAPRIKALHGEKKNEFMEDFVEWHKILSKIGIDKTTDELCSSITDKEEIYGLKTDDYKSVLRMDIVLKGHPEFFDALAEWLGRGHKLIVVKGNHDLEWFWLAVRNYLRLDLAERLALGLADFGSSVADILVRIVLPNVTFIDHAMLIDGDFYVEHGHPYDPLTRVIGKTTVNDGEELNIPFGSFFNRYLLNFLEMDYPFLDNIRPTPNILPLLLRDRFLAGLRLLFDHVSVILKTVPRRYVRYIFGQNIIGRVLLMLAAVVIPPAFVLWHQLETKESTVIRIIEWAACAAFAYASIQALAYFQLKEPDSLAGFARLRFREQKNYRLITLGHTHNPDQFEERGRWFYNTGTWIPMVETSTTALRTDNTFTFLHLGHDEDGRLKPGVLQRWDDEAGRGEPSVLIAGVAVP